MSQYYHSVYRPHLSFANFSNNVFFFFIQDPVQEHIAFRC